ncbi:hypothetical protein MJI47_28860, partial [Salmonella enterica subsp. enterica serovar Kentucky]|nr:hypothetical protein [Salmonella enterica subsp. enterica serovar Kentucky]
FIQAQRFQHDNGKIFICTKMRQRSHFSTNLHALSIGVISVAPSFDINKPIPGFNYLLGQVGWFSEHIPVDNEFDHHTEVEYVCE